MLLRPLIRSLNKYCVIVTFFESLTNVLIRSFKFCSMSNMYKNTDKYTIGGLRNLLLQSFWNVFNDQLVKKCSEFEKCSQLGWS